MKSITSYEIYKAAYGNILASWDAESERNDRFIRENGRPNSIAATARNKQIKKVYIGGIYA